MLVEGSSFRARAIIRDHANVLVDLTGKTVNLIYQIGNGAKQTVAATVIDPINGVAEYVLPSVVVTRGQIKREWHVVVGANPVKSAKIFKNHIRKAL